jgi:hypothetical protein
MGSLTKFSEYFRLFIPIMGFMALLCVSLFTIYLKRQLDYSFDMLKRLFTDIHRIADQLEERKRDS